MSVLICSGGGSGIYSLLVAFPRRQNHLHKHGRFSDDELLSVLQHCCFATFLSECVHQPHPLQPHFKEVQSSGPEAAAGQTVQTEKFLPKQGHGGGHRRRHCWLHRDKRQRTDVVDQHGQASRFLPRCRDFRENRSVGK